MSANGTVITASAGKSPAPLRFSDGWRLAFYIANDTNQTLWAVPISPTGIVGASFSTGALSSNANGYYLADPYLVGDTVHIFYAIPGNAACCIHIMLPWNAATHVMGATVTTPGFGPGVISPHGIAACYDSVTGGHVVIFESLAGGFYYLTGVIANDGNASTAPVTVSSNSHDLTNNLNQVGSHPVRMKVVRPPSGVYVLVGASASLWYLYYIGQTGATVFNTLAARETVFNNGTGADADMTYDASAAVLDFFTSASTGITTKRRTGANAYSSLTTLSTITAEGALALDAVALPSGDTYLFVASQANLTSGELALIKKTGGVWSGVSWVQSGAGGYHFPSSSYANVGGSDYVDYDFDYGTAGSYVEYVGMAVGGTPPTTPVNQSPASGSYVTSTTPAFGHLYQNTTPTDGMGSIEVKVRRVSDSVTMWDSGKYTRAQAVGDAFLTTYGTNSNTGDGAYVAPVALSYGIQYAWSYRAWDAQTNTASAWSTETTFTPTHSATATILSIVSGGVTLTGGSTVATATTVNAGVINVAAGTGSRFSALQTTTVEPGANQDTVTIGAIDTDKLYVGTYADSVLRNGNGGPAIWYRFNETTGTTAADSSGNGRNGTYQSLYVTLAQTGATANGDKSIFSNPGGATAGHQAMRYAAGTGLPTGSGARAVKWWMKFNGTGVPWSYGNKASNFQSFEANFPDGTHLNLDIGGSSFAFTLPYTYNDGAFHFFVLSMNGTAVKLWMDGVPIATGTLGATPNTTLDANGLTIGQEPGGGGPFTGNLAEWAVYPRVPSDAEVLAWYNLGLHENGTLAHTHAIGATVAGTTTSVALPGATLSVNVQASQSDGHTIDATQTTVFQSDGATVLYAGAQTIITPVASGSTIASPTMTPGVTNGGTYKVATMVRDAASGQWSLYSPQWTLNVVFVPPNQPTISTTTDTINATVTVTGGPGSGGGATVTSYDYYYRKAAYSGRTAGPWIPLLLGTTRTSFLHASAPIAWPLEYQVIGYSAAGAPSAAVTSTQVTLGEMFGRLGVRLSYMLDYTRNVAFGALNSWEAGTGLQKAQNRLRQRFQGRSKSVLLGDLQDEWVMPGRSYSIFADEGSGYTIWAVMDKVADLDSLMGPFLLREPNGNKFVVGQMSLAWAQNEVNVWTVTADWGEVDSDLTEIVV